jgi:hypothetical protein
MEEKLRTQIEAVGPDVLNQIVQQDQQDSEFKISHWTVDLLNRDGVMNPDGLWLVQGSGHTGAGPQRHWRVVVKCITYLREEPDLFSMWYQKREALFYESPLFASLPGPLSAPRVYAIWKREDAWWIWMEYVEDCSPQHWTAEQISLTARTLGAFNGAYLNGLELPQGSWLCRVPYWSWVSAMQRRLNWNNPYVQEHLDSTFRARQEALVAESEHFYQVLNAMPQVFNHHDAFRRNLHIRPKTNGDLELVALDWAMAGTGPVGGDLYALLGTSCLLFTLNPAELPALEPTAIEAYRAGLRTRGVEIDEETIHLVYAAWTSLWIGAGMPGLMSLWTHDDEHLERLVQLSGMTLPAALAHWTALGQHGLNLADQARALMKKKGI